MLQQQFVGDGLLHLRQGVERRHGKDKGDVAQVLQLQPGHAGVVAADAQGQVGTAGAQQLDRSRQRARAQLDPGGGLQGIEGLDQVEQGGLGDHAIGDQGELRLPSGGNAAHAVRHGVDVLQQADALGQQGLARLGGLGLAGAAVEQQHIQRFFHLAHAVGQRTGHQVQLSRRSGKTASVGNGLQHGQAVWR